VILAFYDLDQVFKRKTVSLFVIVDFLSPNVVFGDNKYALDFVIIEVQANFCGVKQS